MEINLKSLKSECTGLSEVKIRCDTPKLKNKPYDSECTVVEPRNEKPAVSATPKKPQKLLNMKLSTLKYSMRSPMKSAYMNYINKPSGRRTQRIAPKSACANRRLDFVVEIEKGGGGGAPKKG